MNPIPRVVRPESCSGCGTCELMCSFFNAEPRRFQPSRSFVRVRRVDGLNRFRVEFAPECTGCGRCVESCDYGVLAAEPREGDQP
ncbi:MAG: hypothetical protein Kow0092_24450 [Deferrisomatales bacterium]